MKYKQDLAKVKKIPGKKEKTVAIEALCKTYEVSRRSVYRDLASPNPLVRKIRTDSGQDRIKASKKELLMFRELLHAGYAMQEARDIVEKKSKREITQYQINKITNEIKKMDLPEESMFGDNIEKFLKKYFTLQMIAPEKGVKILLKKSDKEKKLVPFILAKEDVEDLILILVNAYNRDNKDNEKLKLDRNQLVRRKVYQLMEKFLRTAEDSGSIKDLEAITRMKKRLDFEVGNLTPDFKVLEKVVREINPDIEFDHLYYLVEKFSENNNG